MERLEELANRYSEGDLTINELEELETLLLESKEARNHYRSIVSTDAALVDLIDEIALPDTAEFSKSKIAILPVLISAAIAATIVALIALNLNAPKTVISHTPFTDASSESEPSSMSIGVITKAFNIGDAEVLKSGTTLRPGSFTLEKGIIQVEFTSGVVMVIEGPASLDLIDSMNVTCKTGKLSIEVPDVAQGFSVTSKDINVKDLGTAFTMDCSSEGSSVTVTEGSVELYSKNTLIETLQEKQARRWLDKNSIKVTQANQHHVTSQTIDSYAVKHDLKSYNIWQSHMIDLKKRNDLILLYDFQNDQPWQRSLVNKAGLRTSNGAIVGAHWTTGRFSKKQALKFKGLNDRVRVNIPGKYSAMTMTAWIRIDSLDQWLSSLLLTDNYSQGAIHWQLSDEGELIVGMRSKKRGQNLFSEKILGPEYLGQWIFVAMTYDSQKKQVTHYLNGRAVASTAIKNLQTINLGMSEIGNWRSNGLPVPIRGFNGAIDEMAIFSTSLSKQTIFNHFQQGQP